MTTATRRRFLVAGASILAGQAFAQAPGKTYRIGYFGFGEPLAKFLEGPSYWGAHRRPISHDWLERGLARHGFVAGKNAVIHYKSFDWETREERFNRARELLSLAPDVIVSWATAKTLQEMTKTIPIVFFNMMDPVGFGLVRELRRPGGNITGAAVMYDVLAEKRLELARELLPAAKRIALLADYRRFVSKELLARLESAAARVGLRIIHGDVDSDAGRTQEVVLSGIVKQHVDAVLVYGMIVNEPNRINIYRDFERAHRIPFIGDGFPWGVVSLGNDYADHLERAVAIVAQILKGARPAETPVDQTTRFLLTVDLRVAAAIGLKIPQAVLVLAGRVIT